MADDLPRIADVGLGRSVRDVDGERPVGARSIGQHRLGLAEEIGRDLPGHHVVSGSDRGHTPAEGGGGAWFETTGCPGVGVVGEIGPLSALGAAVSTGARGTIDDPYWPRVGRRA